MSSAYLPATRRRGFRGLLGTVDNFMSWMLYGEETWLVAVLKAVPLFFFMYFLLFARTFPIVAIQEIKEMIPMPRLRSGGGHH